MDEWMKELDTVTTSIRNRKEAAKQRCINVFRPSHAN